MKPAVSPKHRYPSGEIVKDMQEPRKETAEQVRAVVRNQRMKRGATQDNYTDQRWGDPLGMMRLWATDAFAASEGLSRQQFDAIKLYCVVRGKAMWAEGWNHKFPRCVGFDLVVSGFSFSREPEHDEIVALKAEYESARSSLREYQHRGVQWLRFVDQLANSEHDRPEDERYWRSALGEVRSAANVLARHFGLMGNRTV